MNMAFRPAGRTRPAKRGSGEKLPLLLLPGTLCDERLFEPLILRLEDWPVIVADMTGADTTPDLAERILAAAPDRFILGGFSLGGIVALEMIARQPERVAGLLLMDTTARPDPAHNAPIRYKALEDARDRGIESYIEDSWEQLVAPANRERWDLRDTLIAMAEKGGIAALRSQTGAAIHRADSRPRLGSIDVPTLVLAGEAEQVCAVETHCEIAEGIAQARLHLVPGAGHFAPLENADFVAETLKPWLCQFAADPAVSSTDLRAR